VFERDKSATPLDHAIGGAAIEFYSALGLLLNVVISAPQDIEPTRDSLLNFQKTIGETASLNHSLVTVHMGETKDASNVCGYLSVTGHPESDFNGLWTLGLSWGGQPHYTKAAASGPRHLYYYGGWGGTWNFDHRDQADWDLYRLDRAGMWNWNSGGYVASPPDAAGPPRGPKVALFLGGKIEYYSTYGHSGDGCGAGGCSRIESGAEGSPAQGEVQVGEIGIECAPTPSCPCTGETWPATLLTEDYGISTEYGSYCAAWEDGDCTRHGCGDKALCDVMWPTYTPGTWCCQPWCYVNETCRLDDVATSVLSGAGYVLKYSYKACTDSTVKFSDATCPWSQDVGFAAASAAFEYVADHAFCEVKKGRPTRRTGLCWELRCQMPWGWHRSLLQCQNSRRCLRKQGKAGAACLCLGSSPDPPPIFRVRVLPTPSTGSRTRWASPKTHRN